MDSCPAYKNTGMKGLGLLKKLSVWKNFFEEDDLQATGSDNNALKESIQQARQEWLNAVANFDQAEGEDMIDYYIYRIKACQVRYNYLLKKAKETGLSGDKYNMRN